MSGKLYESISMSGKVYEQCTLALGRMVSMVEK